MVGCKLCCMVLDDLSDKERYGVAGAFVAAIAVSLVVGFGAASLGDDDFSAQELSEEDAETLAQELMDQDVAQQEAQLSQIAQEDENISENDISVSADVVEVSDSDIGSLFRAEINVEGNVPDQQGEIEEFTEEQELYLSKDGRFIFQPPIDLEAQQQAAEPQPQPEAQPDPEQDLEEELGDDVEGDVTIE